jgi:hypothetical protein
MGLISAGFDGMLFRFMVIAYHILIRLDSQTSQICNFVVKHGEKVWQSLGKPLQ